MFSTKNKSWKTELSELDEFTGKAPRYPLSAIEEYISREMENQNEIIENNSDHIAQGIIDASSSICGSIEKGFEEIAKINEEGFSEINFNLESISDILRWGFSRLIEEQRVTNLLLGNIAILLKIPDIQKERQYYLEQGLKFFQNGRSDNSFYNDSLENLRKAEQIEPTDYFTLRIIGLLYLYSKAHLDLDMAIQYFTKSAKYSQGETYSSSIQSNNPLDKDFAYSLVDQATGVMEAKRHTCLTYLDLSKCYYLKENYEEALINSRQAFKIDPVYLRAKYFIAKFLCCLNRFDEATKEVEELIVQRPKYILSIISDADMITVPQIQATLIRISTETYLRVNTLLEKIKSHKIKVDQFVEIVRSAEEALSNRTYLTSLRAEQILNKKHSWSLPETADLENYNIGAEITRLRYSRSFYVKLNSIVHRESNKANSILRRKVLDEQIMESLKFPKVKNNKKECSVIDYAKEYLRHSKKLAILDNKLGQAKNFIAEAKKNLVDNYRNELLRTIAIGGLISGFLPPFLKVLSTGYDFSNFWIIYISSFLIISLVLGLIRIPDYQKFKRYCS